MRAKKAEQEEARRMRADGASLREIARALNVSHSSVSVWVRDVPRGTVETKPAIAEIAESDQLQLEPLVRCGKCLRSLPEKSFNRNGTGRQWWCRECYSEYFKERGDVHRQQAAESKKRRVKTALDFVAQYKALHPCVDCGEANLVVLDLDHLGDKVREISAMAADGASLSSIREEIAKCEVVCANCHRRRTARRADWVRSRTDWWRSTPPSREEGSLRNLAYAYSYLERSCCVDCELRDLCVLEFDHISSKSGGVMTMAWNGVSLERLIAEIDRCEVRCVNCHRIRTAAGRRTPGVSG